MKNFSGITDNLDITTKKYVDDGLAEKANSSDLATVATSGSYNDLSNKLTAGSNISISGNTISATVPTNYVTTDTEQTITSKKTFNGEVKFGSTENFQGYYIKRMIGVLGIGTAYNNLDSSYKDGTWHRMWRLRFPSGSNFWGKIKITLYGGFSSFNASGVMSKSITCNFNTSNIYNNVGCYDGLGVNVEQDFRISEAIWNATASAWEVLIWQKNLRGNNSPVIMLECWTRNDTNYIKAFNGIAAQTVELTQSTSYSAQRASSTGGTKTVTWATLPVYENPLGEEIATVAMLEDKQDKITSSNKLSSSLVDGLGAAAAKAVDTAITANSTSTNLPTSKAVEDRINAHSGIDKVGTVTGVKMNGTTKNPSSGVVDLGTVITAHQSLDGKQDKITSSNKLAASLVSGLATVATSGSYNDLSNKPTIPTVNNGKLTIQKNGTDVATFTANQSTNTTANITVPTKTSELTNDSGFLTAHQDISGKANLTGGNTFTGKQTLTSPPADGYSIDASGYVKGSWLQAPSTGHVESGTGKVCVLSENGWIYYRTPKEVIIDAECAVKYELKKTINFGQNGVLYVGKFKVYDTNVTCEITSTTGTTYSGKLVIATQNYVIKEMTVYGDAANTVAPNFFIKPSTTSDPYIEVYFKPMSWSKNVVHIYGSNIEAEPTDVCTNVPSVPSTATSKPKNALPIYSLSGTTLTITI